MLKSEVAEIKMMGSDEKLNWSRSADALTIVLPKKLPGNLVVGFEIVPVK